MGRKLLVRLRRFVSAMRKRRLLILQDRLIYTKKVSDLKFKVQSNSHSLLWVWEFSKKAVIACFIFYIIVQIYSMIVMIVFNDITHLGEISGQITELTKDCVFGYFIKAGVENVFKIWFGVSSDDQADDEYAG